MTPALDLLLGTPVWPLDLPDHLSASSLSAFARCNEAFRRRYLLGEYEPKSGGMVWGGADHAAIAWNLDQKIRTGTDLPVSEVVDVFRDEFGKGAKKDVEWDDVDPTVALEQGVALVRFYHEFVAPRLQPLAVEEPFHISVPGCPVPFTGFLDVRAIVDEHEERIIERKTSKQDVNVPPPYWRLQGRLYPYVTGLPLEWHVSVKPKGIVQTPAQKPGLQVLMDEGFRTATERMLVSRARNLLAVYNTFGPDEPWPDAVENAYVCQGCSYKPSCAYWSQS